MFKFRKQARRAFLSALAQQAHEQENKFGLETLESRQMLSVSHYHLAVESLNAAHHRGEQLSTILFGQAPSVVQTGLDTDATDHGLTDPTSSTKVRLANVNGVETYSVTISSSGAVTKLTVDSLGDPVTPPSASKITFGDLSGTGANADTAAATEISTIATTLNLTAPATTDNVRAVTTNGVTTYSIKLQHSSSGSGHSHGVTITVDSAGNPAGNEDVPFSVLSTTIQSGLNALAPTGAAALAADSTQTVDVRTIDGVVLYSTAFTSSGASTKVSVKSDGTAASAPSQTTSTFGALPSTVQTAIQTLATANGVSGAIADDTSIDVYTEANGTVLYSATLSATSKKNTSVTFDLTITVDSNGNPTTLPRKDLFGRFRGGRGFRGFFGGGRRHDRGGDGGGGSGDIGTGTGSGSTGTGSTPGGGLTIGTESFLHQ